MINNILLWSSGKGQARTGRGWPSWGSCGLGGGKWRCDTITEGSWYLLFIYYWLTHYLFLLLLAQYTKLVTSAHEHGAMIVGAGWKLDICHFQQGVCRHLHQLTHSRLAAGCRGHIYSDSNLKLIPCRCIVNEKYRIVLSLPSKYGFECEVWVHARS